MKLLATYITSLFLISTMHVFGCSCAPPTLSIARNNEFNNSSVIVIAKVEKSQFIDSKHANEFTIKIVESFKGDFLIGNDYKILSSIYCTPAIDTGTFLLYLTKQDSNYWVNSCGLSRNVHTPENHNFFKTPPPPPPIGLNELTDSNQIQLKLANDSLLVSYRTNLPDTRKQDKIRAKKELEIELEMLRKKFK